MSENSMEVDDLELGDFDVSASTINSDSEKVDSILIKRILFEMKSEFNRTPSSSDIQGEEEIIDGMLVSCPQPALSKNENNVESEEIASTTPADGVAVKYLEESGDEDGVTDVQVQVKKVEEESTDVEKKPRIILTLRPNDDNQDGVRKKRGIVKRERIILDATADIDSGVDANMGPIETSDKERRSLRSHTFVKTPSEEGLKRSSRRVSKEFGRRSVLHAAIARKEKSFSSIEVRTPRRTSLLERQGAKGLRNKTLKQMLEKEAQVSASPAVPVISTSEQQTKDIVSEFSEVAICDRDTVDVNDSVKESDPKSDICAATKISSTDGLLTEGGAEMITGDVVEQATVPATSFYTKTGKRRVRHFRGLRYTFSGGTVKRKTVPMARRVFKKFIVDNVQSEAQLSIQADYENTGVAVPQNENVEEDLGKMDDKLGPCQEVPEISEGCDLEKQLRESTASPAPGESNEQPANPEPAAVSVIGSADLCECERWDRLVASEASLKGTELYCRAVDTLEGVGPPATTPARLVGCCNMVEGLPRLVRPGPRVPYTLLCAVHEARLRRHNCCPICGNFCTQGRFMQCSAMHTFHAQCQTELESACPHCGVSTAIEVTISLGNHKYPVFLPMQKPLKKLASAKMTFGLSLAVPTTPRPPSPPILPGPTLLLPSGRNITTDGMPPCLDKDKLAQLLHVACGCTVDASASSARYTLRHMYQAAKTGDTERMIRILGSGLNPNHLFREWNMGSALHAACAGGHLGVVHLLIQAGAHSDVLDRGHDTPLMIATLSGHNQVVKYLVKSGASLTFKGGDGMTALHLAAKSGNLEACYYLTSNSNIPRWYIDSTDDGGWTPLVWAAEHCHTHIVRLMLEKRADPLVRDSEQNIALHWAALSDNVDILEALLNYGADINAVNTHGDTPLHIAARQNAYACVVLLLARGAKTDLPNKAGVVPLDCVPDQASYAYTAIKLNMELRLMTANPKQRAPRLLTNDITRGHEANPIQCVNAVDNDGEPTNFVYITENCFTSNINIDRTITSLQSCKCQDVCTTSGCMCGKISLRCWYDNTGKLLPDFNFADPPMLFECNQACLCNRLTCKNRVVQHGITARFQLFRTKSFKGWGVTALNLIPKGSYVCEYVGEIISDCEADTREDDSYLFDLDNRDGETYCIDARFYGNIARFINHSCQPNLLPVRVFMNHQDLHFPRIAFFANKDIQTDEELGYPARKRGAVSKEVFDDDG